MIAFGTILVILVPCSKRGARVGRVFEGSTCTAQSFN